MRRYGFTLVELLVVIAIIALLAGLLFPVFSSARAAAHSDTCMSNFRQIGMATELYVAGSDDHYPQTKRASKNPELEDAAGQLEEPDLANTYDLLDPYTKARAVWNCPDDPFQKADNCAAVNPDFGAARSYIINASFVFGLASSEVTRPGETILWAERRSAGSEVAAPYCDDVYHPWFNRLNASAPVDDMSETVGAVATRRHEGHAVYGFVDTHTKVLAWSQTYSPPAISLHRVDRTK